MGEIQVDFWNAGQGDASSILKPDGSMDIIDVGPSDSSQLCDFLQSFPHIVDKLILTHNDYDHIGALETLLNIPDIKIKEACFLIDRQDLFNNSVFKMLFEKAESKVLITKKDGEEFLIDRIGDYELILKYPSSQEISKAKNPNDKSGIISLCHNGINLITWCGDNKISTVRLHVNPQMSMLFGPHHGAPQDSQNKSFSKNVSSLSPKQCFLSFGYNNQYRHPSNLYIQELNNVECRIICMNRHKCCKATNIKTVLNGDGFYFLQPPRNGKLLCHGHVRLSVNGDEVCDELEAEYTAAKGKILNRLCKK